MASNRRNLVIGCAKSNEHISGRGFFSEIQVGSVTLFPVNPSLTIRLLGQKAVRGGEATKDEVCTAYSETEAYFNEIADDTVSYNFLSEVFGQLAAYFVHTRQLLHKGEYWDDQTTRRLLRDHLLRSGTKRSRCFPSLGTRTVIRICLI